jgi:hypothetical protein
MGGSFIEPADPANDKAKLIEKYQRAVKLFHAV